MDTEQPQVNEKISFSRFLKVYKWIFATYFRIAPFQLVLFVVSAALDEAKVLIYAYIFAKLLDKLIFVSANPGTPYAEILPYLGILGAYYVFDIFVNILRRYSQRYIRFLSRSEIQLLFYKQLNRLGISTLEDPDIQNRIQRCETWMQSTFDFIFEGVYLIAFIVKVIAAGAVIYTFMPIMIPLFAILGILKSLPENHFNRKDFSWQVDNTEGKRKAGTSAGFLSTPRELQEISITGAYKFLSTQYEDFYNWYNKGALRILSERYSVVFLLGLVDIVSSMAAFAYILLNFFKGLVTVGNVTYQLRALDTFTSSVGNILYSYTYLNDFAVKMEDFVVIFGYEPAVKDGETEMPRLTTPPSIEFKNVSFKYPRSDKFIFKDLNLKINSGEEIAIVGHNGAGKTTLVKLMARIYRVSSGEILVNGININDLKIDDWYKNLGVLFQDYNFYQHLTAEENIYLGDAMGNKDEARIIKSAKNADAHDFIMDFKHKYKQIMSERYKDGVRPSTGQQQKIAIARFFYRNAPLIIFDEPTAAIDAVAEYKIFNRIYKFFTDKTVVIISHRFSTVRNADRIIVMEKGKIVEEGTHTELIKKKGTYEHAYKLQAEGYKD